MSTNEGVMMEVSNEYRQVDDLVAKAFFFLALSLSLTGIGKPVGVTVIDIVLCIVALINLSMMFFVLNVYPAIKDDFRLNKSIMALYIMGCGFSLCGALTSLFLWEWRLSVIVALMGSLAILLAWKATKNNLGSEDRRVG